VYFTSNRNRVEIHKHLDLTLKTGKELQLYGYLPVANKCAFIRRQPVRQYFCQVKLDREYLSRQNQERVAVWDILTKTFWFQKLKK